MNPSYDVVVVGSGPNGLAAAAVAARCGLSTLVVEANETIGGGARSAALTLPGFVHDVCSAVHPMARASEIFRELPLEEHGLSWITPAVAAAHPLESGDAALLGTNLHETADRLGRDRARYLRTIGGIVERWSKLEHDILRPIGIPGHPLAYTRFGVQALMPASLFARLAFRSTLARALFAGNAAHSITPLSSPGSAAIGLVLSAVAHVYGWPVPRGGAQAIANALCRYVKSLGGEVVTGFKVERHAQLPAARILLFDTTPQAMARIMADRFPQRFARALDSFPYGPGVFKIDWALSEPIPWRARDCSRASTVHVGGTLAEMAASERAPWRNGCAEWPFVLVTQPSLFDDTRAPPGKHTAWGYCHVPNGSTVDVSARIERQIERFAPGFRDVVLGRAYRSPATLEAENANLVGGDVGTGSNKLLNLLFRPTWRTYSTPVRGVYLCSAATPPGGGVHGMCGYHAAVRAIKNEFGIQAIRQSGLQAV